MHVRFSQKLVLGALGVVVASFQGFVELLSGCISPLYMVDDDDEVLTSLPLIPILYNEDTAVDGARYPL